MPYKIAIASGKGGTGKTTVAVNLYNGIAKNITSRVGLTDCDVEEPNAAIFFPGKKIVSKGTIYQQVPDIDNEKCTFCRKCTEWCEFNAIVVIPPAGFAEVNSSLCHSCGACSVACEFDAITEVAMDIGEFTFYDTVTGNGLREGSLRIGSPMQTFVIKEIKNKVFAENEIEIFDAPPGTSCPVVETLSDADYVVLVTEPTPFGLHDLKLAVELVRDLGKDFGVVVNKSDIGTNDVYRYMEKEKIELLGNIPYNETYASCYAKGELFSEIPDPVKKEYQAILKKVTSKIPGYGERNYNSQR